MGTLARWLALAAIPLLPTLAELESWPRWVRIPLLPLPSFHLIYWWAIGTLAVGAWEIAQNGRNGLAWLAYWQERGRTLAGNVDEIGQVLLEGRGGGKAASPDRIVAGILQQITDVVRDLTRPKAGVHIMACMLVPVSETADRSAPVVALQATTYNQNAGRNKSRIPIDAAGPAPEAYRTGRPVVVANTSDEPYRSEFVGRPYASVMAYPVRIGGESGQILAVVTIDATEPAHFSEHHRVARGIDAAIFPLLKLIGLARIAEQKGGRRGRSKA